MAKWQTPHTPPQGSASALCEGLDKGSVKKAAWDRKSRMQKYRCGGGVKFEKEEEYGKREGTEIRPMPIEG